MAFQEQTDPLIENLQHAINQLKSDIKDRKFKKILKQIDVDFPFVNLADFLEMYIDGEYSRELIKKFHIIGYTEYYRLLQILKLPKKRRSNQKTIQSRNINLKSIDLEKRYKFLRHALSKHDIIKNNIDHNVLRAIVLFHLYSNLTNFTAKNTVIQSIPNAIAVFESRILAPHTSLSNYDVKKITMQVNSIIDDLDEQDFLEYDNSDQFRLKMYQLNIHEYIFNTICNREGITYQDLYKVIKEKIPILSYMPPIIFEIVLHELIANMRIIKIDGYWKFRPSYDEYFTSKHYNDLEKQKSEKNQKFFGRTITPDKFIAELKWLDRGNFEDEDDQVTRIAGTILANSPMMYHTSNELEEFDFAVNLSNYQFTNEQQVVIRDLGLEIRSNIIYVKVMINTHITKKILSDLALKLQKRECNEQGFIISFATLDAPVAEMLKNDKTIQIISEIKLEKWCKITPVIPSRRGSVTVVKYGHNEGSVAKIKSINYESGMADIVLLPDMRTDVQYIGSLEEITLDVPVKQFIEYSNKYFEFLRKLCRISRDNIFELAMTGQIINSRMKEMPTVNVSSSQIECTFYGYSKSEIDFTKPNKDALRYFTDDLFSCICFTWTNLSQTRGLCEHLVFVLNESVKWFLSEDNRVSYNDTESKLSRIEHKMDVFLQRLRYATTDGSNAICPNCDCTAKTITDVDNLFGYRQMKKDNKFSQRRQSRCKKCRR